MTRPSPTVEPSHEPDSLGTVAAARFLHVKSTTLTRLADGGRLPFDRVGARRRFRVVDLERFKATYSPTTGRPGAGRKTLFASFAVADASRLHALAEQRGTTVSALLRGFGLDGLNRAGEQDLLDADRRTVTDHR